MEQIPLSDSMIDCIISNGAFCLAPNKTAAFKEIHRILKPDGRFSVSTSVMTANIDQADGKKWPICMRMFVPLADLEPMLKEIGFKDVFIDMSNSQMQFEIEGDQENEDKSEVIESGTNPNRK